MIAGKGKIGRPKTRWKDTCQTWAPYEWELEEEHYQLCCRTQMTEEVGGKDTILSETTLCCVNLCAITQRANQLVDYSLLVLGPSSPPELCPRSPRPHKAGTTQQDVSRFTRKLGAKFLYLMIYNNNLMHKYRGTWMGEITSVQR